MARIGYARISTTEQHEGLQVDALQAAGCETIYLDRMSGMRDDRPELAKCLDSLQAGDVLTVWRLDRLGRSMPHLLTTVESLKARGVGFESLNDHVDTTSATGEFVFHILAALAEFERKLTAERRTAGIAAAKARGKHLGRPLKLDSEKVRAVVEMRQAGRNWSEIARITGLSRATLNRHRDELPDEVWHSP